MKKIDTLFSWMLSFTWELGNIKFGILDGLENFYISIFKICPGSSFSYTYLEIT